MGIKIVHTADFHIGASFSHLGTNLAKMRGNEIRQSLVRTVDFCKEKNVDALLISGDLFDSPKPSKADCEFVKNTLSSLHPADVYIICGNHDYMCPDSIYTRENYFSDNVHIFPCYESTFEIPEKNTVFWGKSYSEATITPSFDSCVFDETKINILLLHGDADELVPHKMSEDMKISDAKDITLESFAGAGHGLSYIVIPDKYENVVLKFVKRCLDS